MEQGSGDHDDGYSKDTAYLAMAKYCDSFLRMREDGRYIRLQGQKIEPVLNQCPCCI